jgi:hypothetical protein
MYTALMEKEQFLLEIQRLHFEMEKVIHKYGMEEEVISLMVTGLLDYDQEDDPILKAIMSFHIQTEGVLDEVFDFVRESYIRCDESDGDEGGYSLDDMLDDAGIEKADDE